MRYLLFLITFALVTMGCELSQYEVSTESDKQPQVAKETQFEIEFNALIAAISNELSCIEITQNYQDLDGINLQLTEDSIHKQNLKTICVDMARSSLIVWPIGYIITIPLVTKDGEQPQKALSSLSEESCRKLNHSASAFEKVLRSSLNGSENIQVQLSPMCESLRN